MPSEREFLESPIRQGAREELSYAFAPDPWTACPASALSPSVIVRQLSNGASAASNLSNNASILSGSIVTPCVVSLTAGVEYRLEVDFIDDDGMKWSGFGRILAGS